MTQENLCQILQEAGVVVAHIAPKKGECLPYIVYFEVYTTPMQDDEGMIGELEAWKAELYTPERDRLLERKLEAALQRAGIVYRRTPIPIPKERLHQTIYEFEGVNAIE